MTETASASPAFTSPSSGDFSHITQAYAILSDHEGRRKHDAHLLGKERWFHLTPDSLSPSCSLLSLSLSFSLRVFFQLSEQMNRRSFTTRFPSSNSLGHLTLICIICSADVALVSPSMLTTHLPLVLSFSPVTLVHFACWLTSTKRRKVNICARKLLVQADLL